MPVTYEWVIEEVDAFGDIHDVNHADTAAEAMKQMQFATEAGNHYEWGLVRDTWEADDPESMTLALRQWAYVENGALPEYFDEGARVPARFHAELTKAMK